MDDTEWLEYIFGQPLAAKNNPNACEFERNFPRRDALALTTRLFSNCGTLLEPFTDWQVAEGLLFLVSSGESGWMYYLYDRTVDRTTRFDCIRSIETVYRDIFSIRCPNIPDQRSSDRDALDNICFMWWEYFPSAGLPTTTDDEREAVVDALIEVMSKILQLDSEACQESALHGLGHFGSGTKRAQVAIDEWLASHPQSVLGAYAEAAREGNVQ